MTVLFSDIRGFTSISERLQPEQVDEMLQEYLTVMTEVVFRHGGTVDKYIGDAIMGLYNAPYEDRRPRAERDPHRARVPGAGNPVLGALAERSSA